MTAAVPRCAALSGAAMRSVPGGGTQTRVDDEAALGRSGLETYESHLGLETPTGDRGAGICKVQHVPQKPLNERAPEMKTTSFLRNCISLLHLCRLACRTSGTTTLCRALLGTRRGCAD